MERPNQAVIDRLIKDPQPGVYGDIPFSAYIQIPAVNNSMLSRLNHCPASIFIQMKDTKALRFGRALHVYVLEGEVAFHSRYAIAPICDKRTTVGKNVYAKWVAENMDKEPIDQDEYELILAMNASLYQHPYAKVLLGKGCGERTVIWRHDETGCLCKSRTDWVPDDNTGIVIDLKGLEEVTERKFVNACLAEDRGYARAAAFYLDGTSKALGKKFDVFAFICVEKEQPCKVEIYTMEDDILAWGRAEYYRLMRHLQTLEDAKHFPAYIYGGTVPIYRPAWLKDKETEGPRS
jgi:hypothetical protein